MIELVIYEIREGFNEVEANSKMLSGETRTLEDSSIQRLLIFVNLFKGRYNQRAEAGIKP